MIIPLEQLPELTLTAIIEEFIFREGTEYGATDISKEDKVKEIKQQLQQGSALLVYSELHQNVNIIPKESFNRTHEE